MTTPSPLSPVVGEAQAPPIERFRKRAIEVEMMLWDGTEKRAEEIRAWIGTGPNDRKRFYGIGQFPDSQPGYPAQLWVEHSKSWVSVHVGTRVAKEADGNGFYPISPAAIAGTFDPAPEPLELTPAEQAAAETDLHFTTCKVRNFDCSQCAPVLSAVPRYVKAARLVIAEEFERIADAQMAAANDEGYRRGYREALSEQAHAVRDLVDALQLTVEYVGTDVLKPLPGWSWYDALRKHAPNVADYLEHGLAPVAAASNPTPIPDGEE